jgi:hypothetical protein
MLVTCDKLEYIIDNLNSNLDPEYPYRFLCDLDYSELQNINNEFDEDCIEDIQTCQYELTDEFSTIGCYKIVAFQKDTYQIVGYITFTHNILDNNFMQIVRIDHMCTLNKARRKGIAEYLAVIVIKYSLDNTSISAIVSDTNDKSGRLFVDKFNFVKYDEKHLNKLWEQYHSTLFASGNTFKIINEDTTDSEFPIHINKYFTV